MPGRSYPIWIDVDAPDYRSNRSYGARSQTSAEVRVGTSARNSTVHVRTTVEQFEYHGITAFVHRTLVPNATTGLMVVRLMDTASREWCPTPYTRSCDNADSSGMYALECVTDFLRGRQGQREASSQAQAEQVALQRVFNSNHAAETAFARRNQRAAQVRREREQRARAATASPEAAEVAAEDMFGGIDFSSEG